MTLVSVIIPVYNGEKYILNALNCVINQTYRPLEVVVFDDASTDNTFDLATEFFNTESNINVILRKSNNESPKGPGFGRNEAILLSTGSILCHLDVDDEMDSARIEKQVNLYNSIDSTDCLIGCNFSRAPEGN
jgi:glycosyltransferase involved in cell wall biosynthesis